jgi:hypothetical protein
MIEPTSLPVEDRLANLQFATVLTELGDLGEAEGEVLRLLHHQPEDRRSLSLLAKIKHIRGELSAAFALWVRAHALAAEDGGAPMRLATMLRLAQDPERGAGEFLALGQNQLWRKPASMLELERAFRLFVARRPDEAREACAQLAKANAGRDRDLFKLATLAQSWIAELSGDLAGACAVLERLGAERGFENDTDRALALARLYEQLGDAEHLEKAINVCAYLARSLRSFERVTTLGRVAALYRELGRMEEAEHTEADFLSAFRARMHRPSRADVMAAAAERYLPLARLAAIRAPLETSPADTEPRQRAIGLALEGHADPARALFELGGTPLDRKYIADLALGAGERERAVELYLATLADDGGDRRIVGWLLDQLADSPRGGPASDRERRLIRDHFQVPEAQAQARSLLDAAIRDAPRRAAPWRELAALLRLGGATTEAAQCEARADALATAALRRERAMGRVLSAAVYHFADAAKGLVHEIWVTRRRVADGRGGQLEEIFGNLTPEFGQAVRNIFVSVREYTLAKLPHLAGELASFNYAFKVTKEDEPSGGVSAGLPTALALISAFIDRPVPQDIAASGALVADAHDVLVVARVGEAEFKVRGAYNRNLRAVLLPEGSRADVERSHHVPRAICDELVVFVEDLDAAVSFVFGDDVWLG